MLFDSFNTVARVFSRYVADIYLTYPVILFAGVGVTVIVGLAYIVALWCCVGVVVWSSILGSVIISVTFMVYCYIKAGLIELDTAAVNGGLTDVLSQADSALSGVTGGPTKISAEAADVNATAIVTTEIGEILPTGVTTSADYQAEFQIIAYVMTGFVVILLFFVLTLWKRIARAIEIFEEASHAIRANCILTILPFFSVLALCLNFVFWATSTAFIASSGEYSIAELNQTATFSPDETILEVRVLGTFSYTNLFVVFNFFGMLWTLNFINGLMVMITSGAVAKWYWAGSPTSHQEHGHFPVLKSIAIAFRFHLGSIAFGSILVAMVQLVRYIAAYIDARTKKIQGTNKVMAALMCVVHCLLKCLETCVKFISRNAFIMTAMYGDPFCVATKNAFFTISANLAQVATITFLGDIIIRFGQVLISMTAALACWVYLDSFPEYSVGGDLELNTFSWPVFLCWVIAWFVSHEVLSIYDIAVDTILLSFCQDTKLAKHKSGHVNAVCQRFGSFVEKHDESSSKKNRKKAFQGTSGKETKVPDSIAE